MDADLRKKIAKIVRMFGDTSGVQVNAVGALALLLKNEKQSFTDLGDVIERNDEKLELLLRAIDALGTSAEQVVNWMKGGGEDALREIFITCKTKAKEELVASGYTAPHVNGHRSPVMPPAEQMAQYVFDNIDNLPRDKDRDFARNAYSLIVIRGRDMPRMQPWLKDLFIRLGGRPI
jgi:hypothetical protein